MQLRYTVNNRGRLELAISAIILDDGCWLDPPRLFYQLSHSFNDYDIAFSLAIFLIGVLW